MAGGPGESLQVASRFCEGDRCEGESDAALSNFLRTTFLCNCALEKNVGNTTLIGPDQGTIARYTSTGECCVQPKYVQDIVIGLLTPYLGLSLPLSSCLYFRNKDSVRRRLLRKVPTPPALLYTPSTLLRVFVILNAHLSIFDD